MMTHNLTRRIDRIKRLDELGTETEPIIPPGLVDQGLATDGNRQLGVIDSDG